MALLYPWATREYLLWQMSLDQLLLYHNVGIEQKYGKGSNNEPKKAADMTYEELAAKREELRKQYGDIGNG